MDYLEKVENISHSVLLRKSIYTKSGSTKHSDMSDRHQ